MMKTSRTPRKPKKLDERFEGKVKPDPETQCLIWTGYTTKGPRYRYGLMKINGRHQRAHRIAYEKAYGRIPKGKLVLHTCHQSLCVNPAHLWVGTPQDRTNDMLAVRGTTTHRWMFTAKNAVAMIGERLLGFTRQQIAEDFGVSMTAVDDVLNQRTWPKAIADKLNKDLGHRPTDQPSHR